MSEREQVHQIIDNLPDYKIGQILLFLKGVQYDDDIESDIFCEQLAERYFNDPDPEKEKSVPIEELAKKLGIDL